jgi:predicted lipoprotein with Yx(FWY)xxD motif
VHPTLPFHVQSARRRGRWATVPLAAATVSLAAACGGGGGGTSTANSSASSQAPASSSAMGVVGTESTGIGTVLVNSQGRTLYVFANDTGTTSTCTGSCAANWPPEPAPASSPSTVPGVSGPLGSTTRNDGSKQLTVAGHPVYTFAGDTAKGQTKGQGIVLNGGLWTAVTPAGKPDMKGLPSGASSSFSY